MYNVDTKCPKIQFYILSLYYYSNLEKTKKEYEIYEYDFKVTIISRDLLFHYVLY